ncbi:MAG: polysaccharide biosynthesis tyrosine autokinase [Candidatus Hatepunaea meridiana]|nr:polysaccharide biosynthesis tyrosine autokinase [Candidatus Hatepunaea meridiana]
MEESTFTIQDYSRILRRRKYTILWITVIVGLIVYILFPKSKAVYHASASVELIQKNTVGGLLLSDVLYFGEGDNIATQAAIITSQRIVFLAAQRIGEIEKSIAYEDLSIVYEDPNSRPEYFKKMNELQRSVTSKPKELKRSNMITDIIDVTVTTNNPSLSIKFVNAVVDVYRAESLNQRKREMVDTKSFIEKQLAEYTNNLKRSEEQLMKYVKSTLPFVELEGGDILDIQIAYGGKKEQIMNLEKLQRKLKQRIQLDDNEKSSEDWISLAINEQFGENVFPNVIKLVNQKTELLGYVKEEAPQIREINRKIKEGILSVLPSIENRLDNLEKQKNATLALLERNIEYDRLNREVRLNESIVEDLSSSLQDALIQGAKDFEAVRILEFATSAASVAGLAHTHRLFLSMIIGLVASIFIVILFDTFDTSIKVIEDVESFLNLAVLSVIPRISTKKYATNGIKSKVTSTGGGYSKSLGLITHFWPKSPFAEAYRTLRTNIDVARSSEESTVIMFTSSTMREGKTTTISNLAISMAQKGNRVLLIGCNLRRPSLYRVFDLEKKPGVTEIIMGTVKWQDTVKNITDMFVGTAVGIDDVLLSPGLDNLHIITAGASSANPSEQLSEDSFREFIKEVRKEYDIILIDSPPTLPVTDSAIIAPNCDFVVIVYQIGRVGRDMLSRTKAHLESVNAKILGVVLNDIKAELHDSQYSSSYTLTYYGEDDQKKTKRGMKSLSNMDADNGSNGGFMNKSLSYLKRKISSN